MAVVTTTVGEQEVSADFAFMGDGTVEGLIATMGEDWCDRELLTKQVQRARSCLAHWVKNGMTQSELDNAAAEFRPGTKIKKSVVDKTAEAIAEMSDDEVARIKAVLDERVKQARKAA